MSDWRRIEEDSGYEFRNQELIKNETAATFYRELDTYILGNPIRG